MKKRYQILIGLSIIFISWWILASPPKDVQIGPAHHFSTPPESILQIEQGSDYLKEEVQSISTNMNGYDDIVFQDSSHMAYMSGMDGWIWQLNRISGETQKWLEMPLIPAGMQFSPNNPNILYSCTARLGGEKSTNDEKVGLYKVNILTKSINPILLRLPKLSPNELSTTFSVSERPSFNLEDLNETNSRDFCLCNDIAISEDGQRIYISEPVLSQRAAMGSGAFIEAIGLASIGKMWLLDLAKNTISLIVDNFTFVDGLLLESKDSIENAIFFTETTKFRIHKTHLSGKKEGTTELVWDNLPGLPDGMDRDEKGNIWIGIIKERSALINWIHRNPWLKPFFMRIPQSLIPVSRRTGILALSSDGRRPLFYSMHDGEILHDISVACPIDSSLYFPTFSKNLNNVYYSRNPLLD